MTRLYSAAHRYLVDPLVPTTVLLAVLLVLVLSLLTACKPLLVYRYPHACDGHGGISEAWKGIYFCRDGHKVGAGYLWLHPHDPRARP